jgi:hypothetical protein
MVAQKPSEVDKLVKIGDKGSNQKHKKSKQHRVSNSNKKCLNNKILKGSTPPAHGSQDYSEEVKGKDREKEREKRS